MRVALVSHTAAPSGAELAMLDLARSLGRTGRCDVSLVFLDDGALAERARAEGLFCVSLPLRGRTRDLRRGVLARHVVAAANDSLAASGALRHYLREAEVDIVHSNSLKSHVLSTLAAERSRTATLWHVRDHVGPPHLSVGEARFMQLLSRRADAIAAISQYCARPFAGRAMLLPTCVDIAKFASVCPLTEDSPETIRLLSLGRITPWKGHDVVVDAAGILRDRGHRVEVAIMGGSHFGETEYREEITRRLGNSGLGSVYGHHDDVRPMMEWATVVIHAARWPEPFGKVVVEALAAGRPVIATRGGGVPEILGGHLDSWMVPPGNPRALADAALALVSDWPTTLERVRMGPSIAACYDSDSVAREAMALYTDVQEDITRRGTGPRSRASVRRGQAADPAFASGVALSAREATAGLVRDLTIAGVQPLVLRGPFQAEWLRAPDSEPSCDIDLLVAPTEFGRAEAVLARTGYVRRSEATPGALPRHANTWDRSDAFAVDLHWTLVGANDLLWATLSSEVEPVMVGDTAINVPSIAGRCLCTALHAAQHGARDERTKRALRLALAAADQETWSTAMELAAKSGALAAFSAGLCLVPDGDRMAESLGVPRVLTKEVALALQTPPETARGYSRLSSQPGWAHQVRFLIGKLAPSPAFMRHKYTIASRGGTGLVLAYLYRPLWLAWWAPRGYLAWRRAKRVAAASQRDRG